MRSRIFTTSLFASGRRPRSALITSTMAFVWALGCGGRENGSNGTSGSSSGSSISGASSGASAGAPSTVTERNPQCPASASLATGSCEPPLQCEYGTDSHHVCTTTADCGSSDSVHFKWSVSPPAAGCGSNAPSCPVSFTALANGSRCPGVNSFCEYPEGLCRCIPCGDDAGISSMWGCGPWAPTGMGCPGERPLSGDACSVPNEECSYGGYCGVEVGPNMLCQDGYWRLVGNTGSCLIPQCGVPERDASDGGGADVGPDAPAPPEYHRVDDSQCAAPRPSGGCTLTSADGGPLGPCASDLDCQDGGVGGRCTSGLSGCRCAYDECQSDSDCGMGMLCVCHDSAYAAGAGNTCMVGNCRVDTDCDPGGYCSPVHGIDTNCGNVAGYYCHTSRDECIDDSDCGGLPLDSVCAWSTVDARWECQMADVCRVEIQCWRESIVRLEYVGNAKGSWERKRLRRAGWSVNDSRS